MTTAFSLTEPRLSQAQSVLSMVDCGPTSGGQHHAARDRAAASGRDGDLGTAGQLALAGLAAQLQARFVQQPVAVHAPRGQLTAVGVQRQRTVERDARRAVYERAR